MTSARLSAIPLFHPLQTATALVADVIGPALHGTEAHTTRRTSHAWVVLLCLNAAVALFLIAAGQGAGRRGESHLGSVLFWGGVVLLLLPTVGRTMWSDVSRVERLVLLLLVTEALYLYKLFYAPTAFVQFDELLHWITADDILYRGKLFLANPLLPVSPSYPGIEILTTALANLAGLTVFAAANCVIVVLRATLIAALFLFFEKVSSSPRVAAIACLVYMGCSNFAIFDAMFAYESLGIVLGVQTMLAEAAAARREASSSAGAMVLIAMLLASLAVTHHVSAMFCAIYLTGLVVVEALRRDDVAPLRARIGVTAFAAVLAVTLPALWMTARGNPVSGYLGPIIESGVTDLFAKISGSSDVRQMFVGADGTKQLIGYRLVGFASILLLAAGLATGFFRSLALGATTSGWRALSAIARREWWSSRIVWLTLAALGFPVSVAFRLTAAGWEVGNRMGPFVFVAVGLVVAVSVVHFWQPRLARWGSIAITVVLVTIVLGGITTGSGGRALRGPYRVAADPESIEPMGIETAIWTKRWLGEGNRFAADRVSRSLLATYGQQDVITSIDDGIDEARTFLGDTLSPDALYPIRHGRIEYLLVDLRVTTAPAVLGEYFEHDEPGHGLPPPPSTLLKFDRSDRVSRVFDNGWMVIFDVRGLQ